MRTSAARRSDGLDPLAGAGRDGDGRERGADPRRGLGHGPRRSSGDVLQHQIPALRAAATSFPNPGAARASYFQGTVSLQEGPWMLRDIGLWWWSRSQSNSQSGEPGGGYCSVGDGARWALGNWPDHDPALFDPSKGCR